MKNSYTGLLSRSDNAIKAIESGLLTYSQLSAWQKRAVNAGVVRPCEWHHTSAAANRTDFFDPEQFYDLKPEDYPPIKAERATQGDLSRIRITITYQQMVGGFSRGARKKFETITVTGLDVRKSDNCITGARGGRLDSNNDAVIIEYLLRRCRQWREITKKEAIELGYSFS